MSTATQKLVMARISNDGEQIELRAPYDLVLQNFFRSLPNARWSKPRLCWVCSATPAAASRICREMPCAVQAENAVRELAARFVEAVTAPLPTDQPPVRRTDLRRHQVAGYHFAMQREAAMLAHEMGSGKSFTAVAVVENKKCRSVLVLCPVSVRGVWRREFAKWSTKHWHMIVLEKGTVAKKVAHAILEIARCEALNLPYVVVTNYESAREKLFLKFATERKWDAVIYDESHRAKSHNSSISKACEAIGKHARVRLALTGTPMPHSPMDVFGQYRFLDGGIFGTSYTQFRNEYAITGPLGAYHIVGYRNQEKLAERMGLLCHSVKMSDTDIELPPVTHHTLEADLEDSKAYADLEAEMFARIQDGTITAANALVKMIRLQQWTSGCVVDDEGVERITGYEKRDMLENLLTDLPVDEPVIVFANFIRSLDTIRGVGEKLGRKCGEISGRVKDLTANSEYPDHLNLLAVQIRAGGVGIDLTRACYVVYYDHVWSLGDHEQSLKRFDRPGQTRPCQVYHLQLNGTVDGTVVRSLERKKDVVEGVFSYLRERQ